MISDEEQQASTRIFACPQCPKIFATRSNLKRHMENPNIHNIPYIRSRDQKRWKGHSKKVVSKEETTESNNDRMRKWRAENREKNRQNDLRCRVYRLARQKYGDDDSSDKQGFVRQEIARRLGRRIMMERRDSSSSSLSSTCSGWNSPPLKMCSSPVHFTTPPSTPILTASEFVVTAPNHPHLLSPLSDLVELPFYSAPQQKIELPSISTLGVTTRTTWSSSSSSATPSPQQQNFTSSNAFSPIIPHLSPNLRNHQQQRRISSSSSDDSISSIMSSSKIINKKKSTNITAMTAAKAIITTTTQKSNNGSSAFLSVNTTPIPTSSSLLLLTPTTPDELRLLKQEEKIVAQEAEDDFCCVLPSLHNYQQQPAVINSSATTPQQQQVQEAQTIITTKGGIKFVDSNKILDEFVGVVLNYVDNNVTTASAQ